MEPWGSAHSINSKLGTSRQKQIRRTVHTTVSLVEKVVQRGIRWFGQVVRIAVDQKLHKMPYMQDLEDKVVEADQSHAG